MINLYSQWTALNASAFLIAVLIFVNDDLHARK